MAKSETERGGRVGEVEAVSVRKHLEFARQIAQHPSGARADDAEPIGFDIVAARVETRRSENWVDPFGDEDF